MFYFFIYLRLVYCKFFKNRIILIYCVNTNFLTFYVIVSLLKQWWCFHIYLLYYTRFFILNALCSSLKWLYLLHVYNFISICLKFFPNMIKWVVKFFLRQLCKFLLKLLQIFILFRKFMWTKLLIQVWT